MTITVSPGFVLAIPAGLILLAAIVLLAVAWFAAAFSWCSQGAPGLPADGEGRHVDVAVGAA